MIVLSIGLWAAGVIGLVCIAIYRGRSREAGRATDGAVGVSSRFTASTGSLVTKFKGVDSMGVPYRDQTGRFKVIRARKRSPLSGAVATQFGVLKPFARAEKNA